MKKTAEAIQKNTAKYPDPRITPRTGNRPTQKFQERINTTPKPAVIFRSISETDGIFRRRVLEALSETGLLLVTSGARARLRPSLETISANLVASVFAELLARSASPDKRPSSFVVRSLIGLAAPR